MRTRRALLLALALAPTLGLQAEDKAGDKAARTVIVVRHAEKVDESKDPPLSAAGQARAEALATALANARIDAVVTTQLQRTKLTAAPLVKSRSLTPIVVDATADAKAHAKAVAAAVLARPAGEAILVVGHSNTVPAIVAALGGPEGLAICDHEYTSLFVLTIPASGPVRVIRGTFGAPDPPGTDGCRPAVPGPSQGR
ncbi:MAG: histidine phosphatase family protein [Acidobacteria bacterium]|nr:histidine phosphatase family protein [Acidobacteriota bacterium]